MNTESVVYIARKLGWSREFIGTLTPNQFNEILGELYFQESIDEWRRLQSIASILAAIYNTIPRKRGSKVYKASDFLGDMPERNPKEDSLETIANQRGVKLPTKEIRDR